MLVARRKKVAVMGTTDPGGPGPDLYQLLGVTRRAPREDIVQAWRRRARAEHPDSRPGDAAATARFRALAGAWHVLGDPARRAAYDRALADGEALTPVSRPLEPTVEMPTARMTGSPPLWAGPVWVEAPAQAPGLDERAEAEVRFAVLAELAARIAFGIRDWPW
jgi:curved DNA-binding protein CbpA